MITIAYWHGANRELQDKVGFKHGEQRYNGELEKIIEQILKTRLSIMITQKNNPKPPYKEYNIWIDDKNFK